MPKLFSKSIGWAIMPEDVFAHHFKASDSGRIAISRCFVMAPPKDLRPATNQPHCAVCEVLLERSEDQADRPAHIPQSSTRYVRSR